MNQPNDNPTPDNDNIDYSKPVAYDNEGRPLYAHPPAQSQQPVGPQSSVVHMVRPVDPVQLNISPEIRAKHKDSVRRYSNLNLSEGEYVISAVQRHPIGLVPIGAFVAFMILVCLGSIPLYASFTNSEAGSGLPPVEIFGLLGLILSALFAVGGLIAVHIYLSNKFFLTNESVIQEIQHSLFSKHEQTVSLLNIEDASYRQDSIVQTIFNYGSIRLSTEGDETTYRFNYVANPKRQIAILNNAVEAYKNGHPVAGD